MAAITGFAVVGEDGFPIAADAHGLRCVSCGCPVLVAVRERQRGSSADNPAECRACHCKYWVEVLASMTPKRRVRLPGNQEAA